MARQLLPPASALRGLRPFLALAALGTGLLPAPAPAGPLIRRAEERRACQEFAGKLQAAAGNPAQAQQVYQQGVLQLVARFGENPCGSIPAPTPAPAAGTASPSAPGATGSPAPVTPAPAGAAAPATGPAATSPAPSKAAPASAEQQQACTTFAGRLQQAAAAGGTAQARQVYAMGTQKLTALFGPDPCPGISPPQ